MRLPGGVTASMWSRGDDWVSNQAFWRGWSGYEPEVAPLFWQLATAAEVTLDIGAHVGFYTILAALAKPAARVFAFEPLPPVFERLESNIRLNGLSNVIALPRAAGAVDGRAEFFYVPGVIPSSSSLSAEFMRVHPLLGSVEVEVVRLETFAKQHGIDRIDLIKIDTETTEPDVLAGMGSLLVKSTPTIICEVLAGAQGGVLTDLLQPLGYRFYQLTATGPERRETIVADGRWSNYLFARPDG